MTTPTATTYHCPNCNHPLFNVYTSDKTPPPGGDPDTGKASTICPKCGGGKSPGFELCIECNKENLDTCPKCGGNKRKGFPTCFNCRDQSDAPANASNVFAGANDPDADEEDDPF